MCPMLREALEFCIKKNEGKQAINFDLHRVDNLFTWVLEMLAVLIRGQSVELHKLIA